MGNRKKLNLIDKDCLEVLRDYLMTQQLISEVTSEQQ